MEADDERIKILIVDDQQKNLLAMEAVLESPEYRLVSALSGESALKAVLKEDFAVILLDVMMPGMDGFETAELIRTRQRSRYTPIIFVTALSTTETDVERGYTVGAADYLFKPIVPQIMRSKVAAFAEMYRKGEEIKRQELRLRMLQQREHEATLADAKRRMETELLQREMSVAREIQQHLFPKKPIRRRGLDIAGRSVPANAAGGDYFDFIDQSGEFIDVVVGDVSGHGVGPALLMAATRATLRAIARLHDTPGDALAEVNRVLCEDILGEQFVTLLMVRIAANGSSFVYANAGHNPAYLLDREGGEKAQLSATGLPLGISEDMEYTTSSAIALEPGDVLTLYTDGVVEASAIDQPAFGVDRTIEIVRRHLNRSTTDIVEAVQSAIAAYTQRVTQQDDLTLVVVRADDSAIVERHAPA
jgi:serine phosphatase RsbU (regulator of sigma subunit)